MQQARGYQGAVRQMRPRFDQASRESSRVVGARRLAGCPQSRQGFSQALVAWLPSNQELWYASPHDGRALPPPVFIRPSRDTRSRGPKWTRSICSATAVYHENRERTGEYPGYRRERNYLEHSACPQERAFQPISISPLSEPCSFGDALLGDAVFQAWLSVCSLPGAAAPGNNGDRVHGCNPSGGATLFVPSVYRYTP